MILFIFLICRSLDHALLEVRTLAQLDHRRIVRYYSTWIERPDPGMQVLKTTVEDYTKKLEVWSWREAPAERELEGTMLGKHLWNIYIYDPSNLNSSQPSKVTAFSSTCRCRLQNSILMFYFFLTFHNIEILFWFLIIMSSFIKISEILKIYQFIVSVRRQHLDFVDGRASICWGSKSFPYEGFLQAHSIWSDASSFEEPHPQRLEGCDCRAF